MDDPAKDRTAWPALDYARLKATCETLQLWSQVVGKVRLAQTPWLNHSWHVPLYVTARGLSTSLIPHAAGAFDLEFDFVASVLTLRTVSGHEAWTPLEPQSVASFYARVVAKLEAAGTPVIIDTLPSEIADPIAFPDDRAPRVYDAAAAKDFWRALVKIDQVFKLFRTGFLGKASPVHLFWGSFDLAVTRFSGRPAPAIPAACPTCRMRWCARPIRTRSAAPVSGPAAAGWITRPSMPTPIRSRPASATRPSCPPGRPTMRPSASLSCPTRRCGPPPTRKPRCWNF